MEVGYFYAVRGALRQQERLDIISNNLANASNPGFKKDRIQFQDYLIGTVSKDFSQGPLRRTDRDLDVALQGPGFLKVLTPTGEAYTRDGSLHLDQTGNLVTSEGHPVLGGGGPVNVGAELGPIFIDSNGNIQRGENTIATLDLVDLADKSGLEAEGGNILRWRGTAGPEEVMALDTEVIQGSLEMPNVSVVQEMVNLIDAHRIFESQIKAIQSFHEIDSKATNQVGRLR
ncbi:MAG: flagellar hook basal-body protein [Deltaproteobacteria bacterium]|nr:flagellar hook basal-body protein [Deltaproteobacteria bacterium]